MRELNKLVVGEVNWHGCEKCLQAMAPHRQNIGGCDALDDFVEKGGENPLVIDIDAEVVFCVKCVLREKDRLLW